MEATRPVAARPQHRHASALIARNQTIGMLHYFNIALDNNVKPGELSEIITHLAFYSGWSNAFSAVAVVSKISLSSERSALTSFRLCRLSCCP
jgi:alkylhydroperoxidase/carboxymuconolactone decarboxylase family protein YurZ